MDNKRLNFYGLHYAYHEGKFLFKLWVRIKNLLFYSFIFIIIVRVIGIIKNVLNCNKLYNNLYTVIYYV